MEPDTDNHFVQFAEPHTRKTREQKLNHLFTGIPMKIPEMFQLSNSINIRSGNKAVFLRTEITP